MAIKIIYIGEEAFKRAKRQLDVCRYDYDYEVIKDEYIVTVY